MNHHCSQAWENYYTQNSESLLTIPWDSDYSLSHEERLAISVSVAEFQKGESSEGRHLASAARKHADRLSDPAYLEATIKFIKEEQRHSRDLRRYMELRNIDPVTAAWPDTVFRSIRHLSGLEVSICVLVTAEIIAQSYYPALKAATDDPILVRLCEQIISDEDAHVEFQTERIADLRSEASYPRRRVSVALQSFLFLGTVLVVWMQHHLVFTRAGFTFTSYWKDCWKKYRKAEARYRNPKYRKQNKAVEATASSRASL